MWWMIPIGMVHVLAALSLWRLCLDKQGRESFHDQAASNPPTCRRSRAPDAQEKNAQEIGLWEEVSQIKAVNCETPGRHFLCVSLRERGLLCRVSSPCPHLSLPAVLLPSPHPSCPALQLPWCSSSLGQPSSLLFPWRSRRCVHPAVAALFPALPAVPARTRRSLK